MAKAKPKTYTEIVQRIEKLDNELDDWYHVRRNLEDQLRELDREIMLRNHEKWSLERDLIKITICKPTTGPKPVRIKHTNPAEINIDKLSPEIILEILRKLKAQEEKEKNNA